MSSSTSSRRADNFIRQIITADSSSGRHQVIATRFPPEPNGYLHIGHAKSICLNFGIARDYGGTCYLRLDDTNPHRESVEFVESIKADIRWLGFDWGGHLSCASDYFESLYQVAMGLIKEGVAYVCDLDPEQIRGYRGTLHDPGRESPYRKRTIAESLDLFERMRNGEFPDGAKVLRAKIDMASPNLNLRDPVLYRIRHGVPHHRTGSAWCLYPMYDYTHPICDVLEGITHSLCTLEFEDHRPLYDWVRDHAIRLLPLHKRGETPHQIEFSRLNLQYTVMSKRMLTRLVEEGYVDGWDDPRMPTIAGLRRRGFTPESIREFAERIGVTRADNSVEMELLESCIREHLNTHAERRMAVLRPLKVVISTYPTGKVEELDVPNHPQDKTRGSRRIPFSREVWIERDDFMEIAPNKHFKRLVAGGEVRLRNSYVIRCDEVIRNGNGEVSELRCSHDPNTLGTNPEGRKVRGVIHWVSVAHAVPAEICLYDRLFNTADPAAAKQRGGQLSGPHQSRLVAHPHPLLSGAEPGRS